MKVFSFRRALIEIAITAFKRIRLIAFTYIAMTIGLVSYAIYLKAITRAPLIVVFLASSPIFLFGFVVIGIVYFGRKNELGQDTAEITKLHAIFRKLIILYGLVVLLIICLVILTTLLGVG